MNVECFNDLLDGFYNDDVYFHTPSHFLPNLQCPSLLDKLKEMDIVLVIGSEDPFLENNQKLSAILAQKDIRHQLILWDGRAHSGYYWRRMAPLYI
jgi:esterase/lipase superfamily enzyme